MSHMSSTRMKYDNTEHVVQNRQNTKDLFPGLQSGKDIDSQEDRRPKLLKTGAVGSSVQCTNEIGKIMRTNEIGKFFTQGGEEEERARKENFVRAIPVWVSWSVQGREEVSEQ